MKIYRHKEPFTTEGGKTLPYLDIAYHTWGRLNREKNNVLWVCHAFTANSDVEQWWPGMMGAGKMLDTSEFFVICANVIGSCYGSSGPLSINPETGKQWLGYFPQITNRDQARVHEILRKQLGITGIHTIMGASIGAHQSLEYSIMYPGIVKKMVFISSNARQSPWSIAINEAQRLAIEADPTFRSGNPTGGDDGLVAARSIAMLSYRNRNTFNLTQKEDTDDKLMDYRAASYQAYQGKKLAGRYNAWSYYRMTQLSDSHNVGRDRNGVEKALAGVQAETLCMGVSSDLLFPPEEQEYVAEHIPRAGYVEIDSLYGHDGFLVEREKVNEIVRNFIKNQSDNYYENDKQNSKDRPVRLRLRGTGTA